MFTIKEGTIMKNKDTNIKESIQKRINSFSITTKDGKMITTMFNSVDYEAFQKLRSFFVANCKNAKIRERLLEAKDPLALYEAVAGDSKLRKLFHETIIPTESFEQEMAFTNLKIHLLRYAPNLDTKTLILKSKDHTELVDNLIGVSNKYELLRACSAFTKNHNIITDKNFEQKMAFEFLKRDIASKTSNVEKKKNINNAKNLDELKKICENSKGGGATLKAYNKNVQGSNLVYNPNSGLRNIIENLKARLLS